jgi:hypothetical protein
LRGSAALHGPAGKPDLVLRAHEEAERHTPGYQPPPCWLTGATSAYDTMCGKFLPVAGPGAVSMMYHERDEARKGEPLQ